MTATTTAERRDAVLRKMEKNAQAWWSRSRPLMAVQGRDSVTAPCEIKAIRATAGNRLVTVDNSAGWTDLMQDLEANGVQFVRDKVKTIPGTEEARNEFYDAIANNQGDFNGYLGWGGPLCKSL